ncbi:Crp/Fnr family transcriptional regulator [Chloroflexota bacterium]
MAIKVEFISSTPYFKGLSSDDLDSVTKLFFEKSVAKGEIIALEGEPVQALCFVVSGAVKIFKTSGEGKEQILNIARPGESFNEVAIFDGNLNPASGQALVPVVLYGIFRNDLEDIFQKHTRVALNTIKVLAQRLRQLVALVEDLSFKHVIGRVAKILLEHLGDGSTPNPRLTQQEMAAMAGTSREVVSRSLRELEDRSAIRFERHRIIITDRKALENMMEAPN